MSGPDVVLSPTANTTFRQRVLSSEVKFLEEGNLETRHHVQDLVKFLMKETEDFEYVFSNEVDSNTSRRTGKIVPLHNEVRADESEVLCEKGVQLVLHSVTFCCIM
jgi:hypothetical protein